MLGSAQDSSLPCLPAAQVSRLAKPFGLDDMTISSFWVQQQAATGAALQGEEHGTAWGDGADAGAGGDYDDDDAGGFGGDEGGFGADDGDGWADEGEEGAAQGDGQVAAAIQLLQAPRRVAKTGVTYSRAAKQVRCVADMVHFRWILRHLHRAWQRCIVMLHARARSMPEAMCCV